VLVAVDPAPPAPGKRCDRHDIKAIRNEADYEAALARIDALMDAEPETAEGDELDVLNELQVWFVAEDVVDAPLIRSGDSSPEGAWE